MVQYQYSTRSPRADRRVMIGDRPGAVIELWLSTERRVGGVLRQPDHPPRSFEGLLELMSLVEEWYAEHTARPDGGDAEGSPRS